MRSNMHVLNTNLYRVFLTILKGTVSVISSNLPFKVGHHRFTTVPFQPLTEILDRELKIYDMLCAQRGFQKFEC